MYLRRKFLIISGKIDGFLRRTSQRDEGVLFVRRGEAAWLCGERHNFLGKEGLNGLDQQQYSKKLFG
jgi:hypothetical protein